MTRGGEDWGPAQPLPRLKETHGQLRVGGGLQGKGRVTRQGAKSGGGKVRGRGKGCRKKPGLSRATGSLWRGVNGGVGWVMESALDWEFFGCCVKTNLVGGGRRRWGRAKGTTVRKILFKEIAKIPFLLNIPKRNTWHNREEIQVTSTWFLRAGLFVWLPDCLSQTPRITRLWHSLKFC